ncbi:hypothetical protein V1477_002660, partial [Vespula maculifrons]
MVMVDACGSAATETVASISSHVTRVSMYFAVGIGCLPLKESLKWNASNTANQDDIGDRHHGSNGNPRNYFPVAHCSACFLRRNDTKPLASILVDDKWNHRKESSQEDLTLRRVPMMPQAIVPVPSVLEKGSKRAREASDGTQKVQLRVHILYYRFPRAKSEWLVSTRSSWYCRPRASPKTLSDKLYDLIPLLSSFSITLMSSLKAE